jgi:hypothetical protein
VEKVSESKYFAAKDAKDTASIVLDRANSWFDNLRMNGYLDKLRMMWLAYYGASYNSFENAHGISFGGEQGELSEMTVNQIRNIARTIISIITATRPAMQARAINTDYKSLVQTKLANGLLDYYMRDKRLEKYLRKAVESAVVFGSGYIKAEWNSMSGEVYDFNEELGIDIREGDIEFSNLSPFNVFFDLNREDDDHDWVVTRSFKNKFDIAAKYPEYRDKIEKLQTVAELQNVFIDSYMKDATELVPVYEFFHKRSESMPDGRYLLFLDTDIILLDTPMPYRSLPVYQMKYADILGTPLAYTDMFDLLPLQDALNAMYSAILTNNAAFAVQNLVTTQGSNVNISEVSGGMNLIELAPGAELKALQLTSTPSETFNFVGMLEKGMETLSGVNAVSRGKPDPQLRSGNALALLQSMTLQYISQLQQSYVMLIEDTGTGIINMLKDFASVPRVATIVGNRNRSYMKEFTGDDLASVNRVIVDVGNPLANSAAGRVEMAEQMLQMGLLKTPEEYFTVMKTGQLDVMTEDTQSELFLVRGENERLMNGEDVVTAYVDQHTLHIKEHSAVLSDPELRLNPELVERVMSHIQEHVLLLQTVDPNLLQIIGQQPLGPSGGSPIGPQSEQQPSQASMEQSAVQENLAPPQGGGISTQDAQMGVNVRMPSVAQPPPIPGQPLPIPSNPQDLAMRNSQ